ncbi:hypothetical protein LZQ00_03735 [Sphingobacterium sp. SRCM116780]|uniref:hypothetical protein n=1 Tax=Sphingobacterium sp. SRCM116780 TaxID=2907623 RepID=UPI001F3ECD6C|nr:hypothetical protein [Sphingobacterium sp. SRCM116780]UIR56932.1 hypothetical protein LZQ00_03735 [Sphingobacterium sp. SRCM116780]
MSSNRVIRYTSILLLFVIQLLFLFAIFKENSSSIVLPFFIVLISFLLLFSFFRSPIHHNKLAFEKVYIAVWVPIGAVSSYLLNHHLGLGAVFSASLVGLMGALIPYLNKKSTYLSHLPAAIYCGSFIGMSSTKVAHDIYFIIAASICTAVLLIISKSLLNGVGGKLGTLAFAGVAITYLILFLFSHS